MRRCVHLSRFATYLLTLNRISIKQYIIVSDDVCTRGRATEGDTSRKVESGVMHFLSAIARLWGKGEFRFSMVSALFGAR